MTGNSDWQPRHDDPLFILAMGHRESFGRTLFDVQHDDPDRAERAAMTSAKQMIYQGLQVALPAVTRGASAYWSTSGSAVNEQSIRPRQHRRAGAGDRRSGCRAGGASDETVPRPGSSAA